MNQQCRIPLAIQRLGISTQESRGNVRIPGNDGRGQYPGSTRTSRLSMTFMKIGHLGYSGDV